MSIRGKKKILLFSLIFCCCFIAVGYFTLMHKMYIKGNIKIEEPKWEVKFKSIETEEITGSASNYRKPILTDYIINFFAYFKEPNDSIEYEVVVKNSGNLNAELSSISILDLNDDMIKYEIIGIKEGMVLKKGKSDTFKLKLTYVNQNTEGKVLEKSMRLILNWKQAE